MKLFIEDVGLFTYMILDPNIKAKILDSDFSINYGSIFESVVAQLLRCHGFNVLYYYNNKKQGEADFLLEYNGEVLPLEIKSGKKYDRHKAINNLLSIENNRINIASLFHNSNYEQKDKIHYFPIYLIDFLRK